MYMSILLIAYLNGAVLLPVILRLVGPPTARLSARDQAAAAKATGGAAAAAAATAGYSDSESTGEGLREFSGRVSDSDSAGAGKAADSDGGYNDFKAGGTLESSGALATAANLNDNVTHEDAGRHPEAPCLAELSQA